MKAKCIMLQGTGSSVGKSRLVTGLCRIFHQDGYRVAPFKSQNMALNSYITEDGLEMGRAQVAQAQAAGIKPSVNMGPVLLKPGTDKDAKVVVMGKPQGNYSAMDYHERKLELLKVVGQAYDELAREYDIIVIEGAGSPAEINLRDRDIVNMGMANLVNAPVLLVGDIDRGGVFASLAGTLMLLNEQEKARVKGTIINKFRGDLELLKPGLKMLQDIINIPTLGVIPYSDVYIDEEDSPLEEMLRLNEKSPASHGDGSITAKVLGLSRIVNFTDFVPLGEMPGVHLSYVRKGQSIGKADLVIIPGTTNISEDLDTIHSSGWDDELNTLAESGKVVLGIGGGYRILGRRLHGEKAPALGLGLLDIETSMGPEISSNYTGEIVGEVPGFARVLSGTAVEGYAIQGIEQTYGSEARELMRVPGESGSVTYKGAISVDGNVMGLDLHGIFDMPELASRFVHYVIQSKAQEERDFTPTMRKPVDIDTFRQTQFDLWAKVLREHLDIGSIYNIMGM